MQEEEVPPRSETQVLIRPYVPSDREAVRRICCDTADGGRPLDPSFVPDRELFADLMTAYYTDYQGQHVWIADAEGEVVGYLTGCPDTVTMHKTVGRRVLPLALLRALLRGTLLRLAMLKTLWNNVWVWMDSVVQRQANVKSYPAQLHVNLKPGFRGRHVGRNLVERFLQQARELSLPGVEASVREDNLKARRFFESLGFVALRRLPLLIRHGRMVSSVIYAKTL